MFCNFNNLENNKIGEQKTSGYFGIMSFCDVHGGTTQER